MAHDQLFSERAWPSKKLRGSVAIHFVASMTVLNKMHHHRLP